MVARLLLFYEGKICIVEKEADIAIGATKANSAIAHAEAVVCPYKLTEGCAGNAMDNGAELKLGFGVDVVGQITQTLSGKQL